MDEKISLEVIERKRFKGFGVETVQFSPIALECFIMSKNISIYRAN